MGFEYWVALDIGHYLDRELSMDLEPLGPFSPVREGYGRPHSLVVAARGLWVTDRPIGPGSCGWS